MASSTRIAGISSTGGCKRIARIGAYSAGLLLLGGGVLAAQATPRVPPDARVYRDIDQLAAAGLIDTIIVGARPYTEREIARLLGEARRNLGRLGRGAAWEGRIIAGDLARYAPHPTRAIDDASIEAAEMASPYRPAPSDPNGSLDASINPFADYRGGRPLSDGPTATLETEHSALAGPHLAFAFNPRLSIVRGSDATTNAQLRVQSGGVTALFGNLAVNIGRDYALFGQAPTGGLLLSANAPALDMIHLSTERPAALPWVFRLLGPLQATAFVADLGTAHQVFPHSKLIAYHLSMLPHPRLELGVEVLDETGGRGAPPASFGDRVADAVPLIDAIFRQHSDFLFSNKLAGVDARLRVPELAGMELYAEGALDDFDAARFASSLLDDGGYIAGLSLACLAECGRLGVRAEYHQTGIRYYTHTQFSSGVEDDGVILGDPLGPRGLGAYLTVDGETNGLGRVAVSGAYEVSSGNRYGSTADSAGRAFQFVPVERRPGEHRARVLGTWTFGGPGAHDVISATVGIEHVDHFAFSPSRSRVNALTQLRYEYRP
ncbi:MAG TPA: capsule assembly Wzi family protein [Gemmatimonadaceae bacterium]|nr:capsule assembly Wzi family protein [Gemmatimonadaceae bacterium]